MPTTAATREGDTPGLVIIGAAGPAPDLTPRVVYVPTYIVPTIWGAPLRHPRGAPSAPRPVAPGVTSPDDLGFGRFMNNGWTSEGFGRFMEPKKP